MQTAPSPRWSSITAIASLGLVAEIHAGHVGRRAGCALGAVGGQGVDGVLEVVDLLGVEELVVPASQREARR